MSEAPLPRVVPTRATPTDHANDAPNIAFVDPSLALAIGYRLQCRHAHADENNETVVAILVKGCEQGDSPGKTMMILNGFLAKGMKVVHSWQGDLEKTSVLVLVFEHP